jgi:peptide-methionine (R)-S-oxide reductase
MAGKLSNQAFNVLYKQATERPFTSELLKEKRAGTFTCAACSTPVFNAKTKFDSGTGCVTTSIRK